MTTERSAEYAQHQRERVCAFPTCQRAVPAYMPFCAGHMTTPPASTLKEGLR